MERVPATPRATGATSPAGMASAQSPPFRLPGEHFTAALIFLAFGSTGLLVVADELAAGAYASTRVIGVAHLFTLGWITTSIMGALYQLLPVALGRSIRSVRLAHLSFGVYVIGLPVFVTGLIGSWTPAMLGGAATLASGLLLFLINLTATLMRPERRDVTWWALLGAAVFLLITLLLGGALAGNLPWTFLGANRFVALGAHVHVALGGWVLLVVVGVAHRLLPMFLLSHTEDETLTRAAVTLIAAGAGTLALLHHAHPVFARWMPAAFLGGGLSCFLVHAGRLYRGRARPRLDPGMRLAAIGLGFLALALMLAVPVVSGRAGPRLVTAYVCVLVGGFSVFVAAHYYKIVPFLVWYHRYGPLAGRRPVPKVSELFGATAAHVASGLLATGLAGVVGGVLVHHIGMVRAGAAVFTSGVIVEGLQMLRLARRRPS